VLGTSLRELRFVFC